MEFVTPSKMATAITKIASTLYSAERNAIAPSAIHLPIVCMRSLPGSCFLTHAARM